MLFRCGIFVRNGGIFLRQGGIFLRQGGISVGKGGIFVRQGGIFLRQGGIFVRKGGIFVRNGGIFVRNGGIFVRNGGILVRNGGIFVRNGGIFVRNGGILVRNGGIFVRNGGILVRNGGILVRNGGISVRQGGISVRKGRHSLCMVQDKRDIWPHTAVTHPPRMVRDKKAQNIVFFCCPCQVSSGNKMHYRKIHIIGGPGSGKTYSSKIIEKETGVTAHDLDRIFWDHSQKAYVKAREEVRSEKLEILLSGSSWIIEGVYYKWLEESFRTAEIIAVLTTPVPIRQWRILKRFLIRKFLLGDFEKETFRSFVKLWQWNKNFDTDNMVRIAGFLSPYTDKIIYCENHAELMSALNGTDTP
jgi:adenylate kinase family enzyme